MKRKVVDENGRVYPSLGEAFKALGMPRGDGGLYSRLKIKGYLNRHGHRFEFAEEVADTGKNKKPAKVDPVIAKLQERYSQAELEQLAKGEGIQKRFIPFPEIHLTGEHHKVVVMSDTHIGSVYSPEEWHDVVSTYVNDPENGVECVLHCGDLVDGFKIGRAGTQVYELSEIGFEAQKKKAIQLMSKYEKPVYIISGNHDMYFQEFAGANLVKAVCDAVPNMTYIGHDQADIEVGGAVVRLFHGGDGSNSYAVSYRLQKLIEAINGGHKPNILLAGHVHKFCYIFERNIHTISVPCMQAQTNFMRAKKLAAHIGFLALEFDVYEGTVCNLGLQYFPFYA